MIVMLKRTTVSVTAWLTVLAAYRWETHSHYFRGDLLSAIIFGAICFLVWGLDAADRGAR